MDTMQPYAIERFSNNLILMSEVENNKDSVSRMGRYISYLDHMGLAWWDIDLNAYRNYLRAEGLAESSIGSHLSTVRSVYRRFALNRRMIYDMVDVTDFVERKAIVDELVTRIENALHSSQGHTQQLTIQDKTDTQHIWLTVSEVTRLIDEPERVYGPGEPLALRDRAILAFLVTTGLREAELCALNAEDLRQVVDGQLCVLVRHGKGNKQRAVPYGDLLHGLQAVDRWLDYVETQTEVGALSPVFWAFWKGGRSLRGRLSVKRAGEVVSSYWIERSGEPLAVAPHDLRRTYARLQFEAGMDIYHISRNMGHTSIEMTRRYIGETSMKDRRNRNIFKAKSAQKPKTGR